MRVGVEVGGTFTDLVATGRLGVRIAKVPSVPARPEESVFTALAAAGIAPGEITDLIHGSTVATNAVLERKGASTAFVTTAGFTDLLLIQRQDRPKIYQLVYQKPAAIVERRDTLGIEERVLADGSVAQSLDLAVAEQQLRQFLAKRPYKAIAICLLNAYANPQHEIALARLLRSIFPSLLVSCSHEICGEFREYERASTTVLAAYVQPTIDGYLGRLESRLAQHGFAGRLSVMQSNGGCMPAVAMRRNAVTALFSGPAAGVTGALRQAGLSGYSNLVTVDMGGTSTDVSLISQGRPTIAPETRIDGLPVRTPMVDITTIGAGGGSIVWCDQGGMLRVGPHSSGADPGPACYGRGGTDPTITDAHVIRGTIEATTVLGGRLALDVGRAQAAFAPLAAIFAMSIEEMADSAIRLADANIARAVQLISTEKGLDPRDYVLVPFGGAGPLHAGRVAEILGLTQIVVPRNAGVLSALGLLVADTRQYETVTRKVMLDEAAPTVVRAVFKEMQARLSDRFSTFGVQHAIAARPALQMRFAGQAFELDVAIDADRLAALDVNDLRNAFETVYRQVYFNTAGNHAAKRIEIVGFRLGATVPTEATTLLPDVRPERSPPRRIGIYEFRAQRACAALTRHDIDGNAEIDGPALIDDNTATIYLPPGWRGQCDLHGNLLMRFEGN